MIDVQRARLSRRSFVGALAAAAFLAPGLYGCSYSLEDFSTVSLGDLINAPYRVRLEGGLDAAMSNSRALQEAIDAKAADGGGRVILPAGTYYFDWTCKTDMGNQVILMRSNVTVAGAGMDETVLKPYGTYAQTGQAPFGIDMFYYDGLESGEYLENACFADFSIDGSSTLGDPLRYNASGKGFFFKLFKDCAWMRVAVVNTDGTGFGADFPVGCVMKDCYASGCGKNASSDSVGASGFGVGVGYSNDESILIENCVSDGNAKFGYFFEHQSIFSNEKAKAVSSKGFIVRSCSASGNLVNFGGNRAYDARYVDCVSDTADLSTQENYTTHAFRFVNDSVRITVEDGVIDQAYRDVAEGDDCYKAVVWALARNVAEVGAVDYDCFRPEDLITRGETAAFLWRYAGRPGEVSLGPDGHVGAPAVDVLPKSYFANAVRWLRTDGLSVADPFRPNDLITQQEFVTMLWRYARLLSNVRSEARDAAKTAGGSDFPRALQGSRAASASHSDGGDAVRWSVEAGILASSANDDDLRSFCTRSEAIRFIYKFHHQAR